MPQVQVIQPIQQQPKRLRVAAYARVSSDSEDQLNSLSVQVDYYTHLIQENAVHTEILQISKQLHNLTRIHAQGYIEETVYQERRIRIEQQLAEKKKCLTCQKQNGTAEKALYQTKQIDRYMQNHTALTEFDEEAMRTIVKKIVVSNEAFVFELPNGLHLKEKRQ